MEVINHKESRNYKGLYKISSINSIKKSGIKPSKDSSIKYQKVIKII